MSDEGQFEPGFVDDVMPPVPILGAGKISVDGDALRLEVTQGRRFAYDWIDVIFATSDARDPRVILFVVQHEGEPKMLRFRPVQPTPPILADLDRMFSSTLEDVDDLDVEIAPCLGKSCRHCVELEAMLRANPGWRPS